MASSRGTALKKRPRDFNSLEGQDFVVETLKHSIEKNKIANAYIFSGPRGVGKTSSARAFARCLNCKNGPTVVPCGECNNCKSIENDSSLDVVEIDGASNTSVQDIRQIKEEIMFPPAISKYRIYIIDEVHMLSNSAFNALLKTIEEPPNYIVFIFATTESHKLPETIKSRCQHFSFKLLSLEKIYNMLKKVCFEDHIKYEDGALKWIAYKSSGSVRDAYTLFDQVVSFTNSDIKLNQIRSKMGLTNDEFLEKLSISILNEDVKELICVLDSIFLAGVSYEQFMLDSIEFFREALFLKIGIKNFEFIGIKSEDLRKKLIEFDLNYLERIIVVLLETYRDLQFSINPRYELEINFIKILRLKNYIPNHILIKQIQNLEDNLLENMTLDSNNFDVLANKNGKANATFISEKPSLEYGFSEIKSLEKEEASCDENLSTKIDKNLVKTDSIDEIDEIFIEDDNSNKTNDFIDIRDKFIYIVSRYIQTLVHSGEVVIDDNVLYYKVFSEFEYNELQNYKGEIRSEFYKEFPNLNIVFQKNFKNLEKDFEKLETVKNIFGASEVLEG
ncbi:DNA polymerase III subunit gamma/tau [Borreliella yangtzensis]|uniref:DNA polymerase III subunit gamma/tau n=1 Tax=Borreliella yangtzensis TaxID=683292 RepID=A0ABR6P860_9SPIR|nr:DNA polymerase III subunit gamma/tau [Borreliella yangtzensis]MBB6042453.1 DNA polymerase-3 subunit gamma/tau [Borreliella yangtzensis]WKC73425.1 DNA polymerase III subunit gamma/tau [Borreliella yangtzensis]WKC74342.1 DNA polymerase III subunit gamma/tau [Borreliella yangtzensis]